MNGFKLLAVPLVLLLNDGCVRHRYCQLFQLTGSVNHKKNFSYCKGGGGNNLLPFWFYKLAQKNIFLIATAAVYSKQLGTRRRRNCLARKY